MRKHNSIVRTKTTFGSSKKPNEMYCKIEFMTLEKAVRKLPNRFYTTDEKFEIYPYKHYDLRWLYEIPAYWFLLRILRRSESSISRQMHNRTSTTVLLLEILSITKPTIELIKLFI
ncbi:hypothetical protein [Flavobacterium sp. ZB4R12]|uniref:hypothetical protein n=1 Tax=Flavobacterium sp. ZB4R12 TaxID=3398732 RepID=UPI003AAE101A